MALHGSNLDCVERLKILADETRLQVLRLLLHEDLTVGEIGQRLGTEATLLSHHLRTLRAAGLVQTSREGKRIRYRLVAEARPANGVDGIDLGCCVLSFDTLPTPQE